MLIVAFAFFASFFV